jgi:predicted membrane metal-binding protein
MLVYIFAACIVLWLTSAYFFPMFTVVAVIALVAIMAAIWFIPTRVKKSIDG